nr:HD domain-containing protein [Paenibacillus larvae]
MESEFFAYMYRLKHIERWSLMRNTESLEQPGSRQKKPSGS